MYSPLLSGKSFVLHVSDNTNLVKAFAFDVDRLACACFESFLLSDKSPVLPRSTGWPFIKSYYGAFFGAHSIMRITGVSCTQIDEGTARSITRVAKLFGADNGLVISAGYYRCMFDTNSKRLFCDQISAGGGSHEAVWKAFTEQLKSYSSDVLKFGLKTTNQPVSSKLSELRDALLPHGGTSAGWLSSVRNRVNYQQAAGCWYPYYGALRHDQRLFRDHRIWLRDPMEIPISQQSELDVLQAFRICQFIASVCRIEIEDLASRCSSGKSFKSFCDGGSRALLHQSVPRRRRDVN
jgi:hypothetical protein